MSETKDNITNYKFAAGLQALVEDARSQNTELYAQWCMIGRSLADIRSDQQGHAFEHLDANVDLVLRGLEADQTRAIAGHGDKFGGGVFFLQMSLSKMWLFAVYEGFRQTCEIPCIAGVEKSKYCNSNNCIRCKFVRPVRDKLAPFRVALAKLEPQSQLRKTASLSNYHPQMLMEVDGGSVGWEVWSDRTEVSKTTSRLEISNFILKTHMDFSDQREKG